MTSEVTDTDPTEWPLRVEAYLRNSRNPAHRAMLRNFYRHLLLELSGCSDRLVVPEPTVVERGSAGGHETVAVAVDGVEAVRDDSVGQP
ncbi:hypothetical protein ACWC10_26825 [Streptomyces sp. NPDC001595]|uniref:hypothetical protein n=1 Tax=Streptomyces sp. NPDC001532 TaxID=3154520 RepID=UPI0033198711